MLGMKRNKLNDKKVEEDSEEKLNLKMIQEIQISIEIFE